ncbi:phenylacetate--CoA ligase family protein [Methanococcoides burtonii]|uniref:Phenylacetate-coenzyme A ligase n=1 Tax=Methanococcoides burtonii (strain DSM 6242 / NBRC 107633 / OCM 468 / ACE-M) TaxID=259564 RepID=Q12ZA9_METBU|nr:phenylacetate--CoA ligase [Methanococcoides burtonii]ABE51217.1 Phenylacetate-coenzyme A ligase [Methanococcoides burtonii DSM 6242]
MIEYWNPQIERMPVEELKNIQGGKLCNLIIYVYEHSPFYRKQFDDAGIRPEDIKGLDDVTKLPFTYKKDLRDTYPTGMFCVPNNKLVRFHVSSGTTGKPTVVGYTDNDIKSWTTSLARALTSIGIGRNDIMQIGYGYGLFTGGLGMHYGAEETGCTVLPTSSGNTDRQIELMQDLGTSVIGCTPSYFLFMIEAAKEAGISFQEDTNLRIGVFGAEPWSEEMRKRIEESSGIKAYDIFGTSELSGPLFTECREQNGIHVWADQFLVEVIDPETGEPVADGERGELVITTLVKEALPLIRYRIGDITVLNWDECECGRTHPRIMRVLGRADDMLIVRGINVFPSQVESVLMKIPEVGEHFMIIVDRVNELDIMKVQIEMTDLAFSDKVNDIINLEKKVAAALKGVLNIAVKVELVEHGSLPRSMGKAKKVIDNRKL